MSDKSSYNLLNEYKYIRNKNLCLYDSNYGYIARFNNTDLDGWDTFINIEGAGNVGSFFFGISSGQNPYMSRQYSIPTPFEAEFFWQLEIDMMLEPDWEVLNKAGITEINDLKARLEWKTQSDSDWNEDSYIEFNVSADKVWHRYVDTTVRQKPTWISNIVNFKFYPIIGNYPGIRIFIKKIAFISPNYYKCRQPACSYYNSYSHPCKGTGEAGYAVSNIPKTSFELDDSSKQLGVSIDGHDIVYINLDLSNSLNGYSIAADISRKLSSFIEAGYLLAECMFDDSTNTFTIKSGSRGADTCVYVFPGLVNDCSSKLGFYSETKIAEYRSYKGEDSATLFREKYRRLPATTLYSLLDSEIPVISYRAGSPAVEIGKRESLVISNSVQYFEGLGKGTLLIDYLGKANYYGNLSYVFFSGGIIEEESRFLLLRPVGSNYTVIGEGVSSVTTSVDATQVKSLTVDKFAAKVDWYVRPGDVIGLWRCAPAVGKSTLGGTKAFYEEEYRSSWIEIYLTQKPEIGDSLAYTTNDFKLYGGDSLPVYSQSSETINDIGVEIELKSEFGIESIIVTGVEEYSVINYNMALMKGTEINAYSGANYSIWVDAPRQNFSKARQVSRIATPRNTYALNDNITVALGGSSTYNQTETDGTGTYFYVDSDLEWYPPVADYLGKSYSDTDIDMPDRFDGRGVDWGERRAYTAFDDGVFSDDWWIDGEQRERIPFWIEIWFSKTPNIKFDIGQIISYFVEEYNLIDFCLEYYIEPEEWDNHNWSSFYAWPIKMIGEGTSVGWKLFEDPVLVLLDGKYDVTSSKYFTKSYVTSWMSDNWPGLDYDYRVARKEESYGLFWTSLSQTFNPVKTRAIRLYSWRHYSTKITEIRVMSSLIDLNAITNSVSIRVGNSTPVFNSNTYELTTVSGEQYSSSRLTFVENMEDWSYPSLSNSTITSGVAIAPVGRTISKFDIEISDVDIDICSLWVNGQERNIRIENNLNQPTNEIDNLSSQLSLDTSELINPTKEYTLFNDNGIIADLHLDLATKSSNSSLLYSSSLSNAAAITNPTTGPAGSVIKDSDFEFTNMNSAIHNSKVYYLNWKDNSKFDWYKKTTNQWIKSKVGNPFSMYTNWNELENSNRPNWYFYNICYANRCSINYDSAMNLYFNIPNVTDFDKWNFPTYYTSTTLKSNCTLRMRLDDALEYIPDSIVGCGLVIFDNNNKSNYITISRNSRDDFIFPATDWVITNNSYTAYTEDWVYLYLIKDSQNITLGYRNRWDSLVILEKTSITGWSDDLRIGIYASLVSDSSASTEVAIPWMDFESAANYIVDNFVEYSYNPMVSGVTYGDWNLNYPYESLNFYSTHYDNLYVKIKEYTNFITGSGTSFSVSIGDKDSQFKFSSVISDINFVSTSGQDFIGINLTLSGYKSYLEILPSGVVKHTTQGTTEQVTFTSNNLWIDLELNNDNTITSYYSEDGVTYEVLAEHSISSWPNGNLTFSIGGGAGDIPSSATMSGMYIEIEKPTSIGYSLDTHTEIAVRFDSLIPILDIFGRGFFDITGWSHQDTEEVNSVSWSSSRFDYVQWIKLCQASQGSDSYVAETNLLETLKVISDPYKDFIDGNPIDIREVSDYKSRIYSYCKGLNSEYTPYYDTDYPVIIIDFGQTLCLSRAKFTNSNLYGRFSNTETSNPSLVEWESSSYPNSGFNRKCVYSNDYNCNAPFTWGKPRFEYGRYPTYGYKSNAILPTLPDMYYAFIYGCNGLTFSVGDSTIITYQMCPVFYLGNYRWMLQYSTNAIYKFNSSDGLAWQIDPIQLHPSAPIKLVDRVEWWDTSSGALSIENGSLCYRYDTVNQDASFSINRDGCDYFRFSLDDKWTVEDSFQFDLKLSNPEVVDYIGVAIGKSPKVCWYFEFDSFYNGWNTYAMKYSEADILYDSSSNETYDDPTEVFFTSGEKEYYNAISLPKIPMMFLNFGYIEIFVRASEKIDLQIKNLKNIRTTHENSQLFLGNNSFLQVNSLPLSTTAGTVEFDFLPSHFYLSQMSDPRQFDFSILSIISNLGRNTYLYYKSGFGWNIILTTSVLTESFGSTNYLVMSTDESITKTTISPNNPDPMHIVLSWDSNGLSGLNYNIALWVNGHLVIGYDSGLLNQEVSFSSGIVLGGSVPLSLRQDGLPIKSYGFFSNIKVYSFSTNNGIISTSNSVIPEKYIDLSKDGVSWKGISSGELPLIYEDIPDGGSAKFYIRNRMPNKVTMKTLDRLTSYIIAEWVIR